jgi:hypothetical protein
MSLLLLVVSLLKGAPSKVYGVFLWTLRDTGLGQSTTPSPNLTSILNRLTALEYHAPGHPDTNTSELQEQVNMLEATLCNQSTTIA